MLTAKLPLESNVPSTAVLPVAAATVNLVVATLKSPAALVLPLLAVTVNLSVLTVNVPVELNVPRTPMLPSA